MSTSMPIQTQREAELYHALAADRSSSRDHVNQQREVWDHDTLLWSVGNDVDFFIELVRKFLISYPRTVASVENSLRKSDVNLPAVEAVARALRESLQDLAAKPAAAAARKLENAARVRDRGGAQAAFRRLQDEISDLAPAFDRIGEQLIRSEF